MLFLDHIYLIPLFPAFGATIMFFFGRRLQKATIDAVCVGAIVVAFLFACFTVIEYTHFARGTGQPFEKMDRDVERDFILSPPQAVEYGLIDSVLSSRDLEIAALVETANVV